MFPTDDRDHGEHRQRRLPVVDGGPERDLEEAHEDAERGHLGRHRHERGHRRGGALVDVRRPLMEGGDRDLEGEPGCGQRDPDQDQRVVGEPGADPLADAGEVGRARAAVDEGQAVEQGRRAERADDQVLEARLERVPALRGPSRRARRGAPRAARSRRRTRPGSAPGPAGPCRGPRRAGAPGTPRGGARLRDARRPALATTAAPRPRRRGSRSGRRPVPARRAAGRPRPGPRARPTARCTGRRRRRAWPARGPRPRGAGAARRPGPRAAPRRSRRSARSRARARRSRPRGR